MDISTIFSERNWRGSVTERARARERERERETEREREMFPRVGLRALASKWLQFGSAARRSALGTSLAGRGFYANSNVNVNVNVSVGELGTRGLFDALRSRGRQVMVSSSPLFRQRQPERFASNALKNWRRSYYELGNRRLSFRGVMNDETVLYTLIGINAAVFMGWQALNSSFMLKHFAFSTESIRNLRPWTLVTSIFSQFDFSHLAVNMLGLFFWGREIGRMLGGTRLLGLYLAGGLVGNLVQLGLSYSKESQYRWGQPRATYGLGASGAVNSIVTLSILFNPKSTVLLYFVIPVPAALLGLGFILRDFAGLYDTSSQVSHAGHLGGAAAGLIYWLLLRRRVF